MTDAAPSPARPFHALLGLKAGPAGDGKAEVVLPENPGLGNSRGDVHGGAIATLIDAALANAARTCLPEGYGCATVSLTVQYLEPARGTLRAEGRVLRAGRTLVSVEAGVHDAHGKLVAHAVGTMRAVRSHGGGRGSPQSET